jgi:hypothetical protein
VSVIENSLMTVSNAINENIKLHYNAF